MMDRVRSFGFKAIDLIFGKTFWSTVIRPALIYAVLVLLVLVIDLFIGEYATQEGKVTLVTLLAFAPFWLLGPMWVGWGFAYWRFETRPIKHGRFAHFPMLTGFFAGPLVFLGLSRIGDLSFNETIPAMVFSAVAVPFMALMSSAFFRYAPQFTALRK